MKTKSIILIIVIAVVVIIALLVLLNRNNTRINSPSGDVVITTPPRDVFKEKLEEDIKNGYSLIEKNNIVSSADFLVENISYKDVSDKNGKVTLVNVYILNSSQKTINKNTSLTISLFDDSKNLTNRFGGVIESNSDIEPGERTIVKTQFLSDFGNSIYAEVTNDSTERPELFGNHEYDINDKNSRD